jgi:hypothetical protein
MRIVPGWLLVPAAKIAFALILNRYRESFDKNLPGHHGIHLWVQGINADLYVRRLSVALDLIELHAPVYIRWLRSRLPAIAVDQMFMIMPRASAVDLKRRVLVLKPQFVWKVSPERLAVHLVFNAVRARLGRRFSGKRTIVRVGKRMYVEAIAFARYFPGQEALVAEWERTLAMYTKQNSQAAA